MWKLHKLRWPAGILVLAVGALTIYLLRGGFRRFAITPYRIPPAAFSNWRDARAHPNSISITTFQTGVVHMDACLNLDPSSPRQADCDHVPLAPQTEFIFGQAEASFLARAAVANHFSGKSKFSTIDFSSAPAMAPLGPSVDVSGTKRVPLAAM